MERDDGYAEVVSTKGYFEPITYKWSSTSKQLLKHAKGRVVDVGCGAGIDSILLQNKGYDVTGIDASPFAVRIAKARGLKKVQLLLLENIDRLKGPKVDAFLMMGHNFGLFGGPKKIKTILKKMNILSSDSARILASVGHIYKTNNPVHLAYHEFNRKRGRMAGQLRLRIRYRNYCSPWHDYLFASPEEIEKLLIGTNWKVDKFIESNKSSYGVILIKK